MEKFITSTCFMQNAMIVELSKGRQITIPAEIREQLNLKIGSKLEITRRKDEIILKPLGEGLEKLFAEAKALQPKHNLSPKQMDDLNEGMLR